MCVCACVCLCACVRWRWRRRSIRIATEQYLHRSDINVVSRVCPINRAYLGILPIQRQNTSAICTDVHTYRCLNARTLTHSRTHAHMHILMQAAKHAPERPSDRRREHYVQVPPGVVRLICPLTDWTTATETWHMSIQRGWKCNVCKWNETTHTLTRIHAHAHNQSVSQSNNRKMSSLCKIEKEITKRRQSEQTQIRRRMISHSCIINNHAYWKLRNNNYNLCLEVTGDAECCNIVSVVLSAVAEWPLPCQCLTISDEYNSRSSLFSGSRMVTRSRVADDVMTETHNH